METLNLIFWFGYVLPTAISLIRLVFCKETTGFIKFTRYAWYAFIPIWSIVCCYFIALDIRDAIKEYFNDGQ